VSDSVLTGRCFEIDALIADGMWVACRCRLVGKHTGAMPVAPPFSTALGVAQIEPTFRDITMSGMIVAEIEDGCLVSGYGEWDRLGLLVQMLGAAPAE
jgi:predicted ester cyclase